MIDWPLNDLRRYAPAPETPAEIDRYWQATLAEAQLAELQVETRQVSYPVDGLTILDVRYDGWRGARIAGLYLAPRSAGRSVQGLAFNHGYSGNKGHIHDYLAWALMGYAVLAVDVRGQAGQSTDPGAYGHGRGTTS